MIPLFTGNQRPETKPTPVIRYPEYQIHSLLAIRCESTERRPLQIQNGPFFCFSNDDPGRDRLQMSTLPTPKALSFFLLVLLLGLFISTLTSTLDGLLRLIQDLRVGRCLSSPFRSRIACCAMSSSPSTGLEVLPTCDEWKDWFTPSTTEENQVTFGVVFGRQIVHMLSGVTLASSAAFLFQRCLPASLRHSGLDDVKSVCLRLRYLSYPFDPLTPFFQDPQHSRRFQLSH